MRESETLGSPLSHACLRAFVRGWTRWAGWPRLVRCDRGTYNRGIFSSSLAKNGVVIRLAGLKAPEQIGRGERRGDALKKMMSKVIKDTHASHRESMDMMLERRQRYDSTCKFCSGAMGAFTSSTQSYHHEWRR